MFFSKIIGMGLMALSVVALPNALTATTSSSLAPATTGGVIASTATFTPGGHMSPVPMPMVFNASATAFYLGNSSSLDGSASHSIKISDQSVSYTPYCTAPYTLNFCQSRGYQYVCDYFGNLYISGPTGEYPECSASYDGGGCFCLSNCPGSSCNGSG